MKQITAFVKQRRKEAGLSQEQFAERVRYQVYQRFSLKGYNSITWGIAPVFKVRVATSQVKKIKQLIRYKVYSTF